MDVVLRSLRLHILIEHRRAKRFQITILTVHAGRLRMAPKGPERLLFPNLWAPVLLLPLLITLNRFEPLLPPREGVIPRGILAVAMGVLLHF